MKDIRIKAVNVQNIAPFKKLNLTFLPASDQEKAEIHIFTGTNGTGKTTLLNILTAFVNDGFLNGRLIGGQEQKYIEHFYCVNGKEEFYSYVAPSPGQWGGQSTKDALTDRYFSFINTIYNNYDPFSSKINFAAFGYSGNRGLGNGQIKGISEIEENPLQNALSFGSPIDSRKINQWIANNKTKYAIALSNDEKEAADNYYNSIKKVEYLITEITGQKVKFELETNPLSVIILVDGLRLNFNLLPDGLKSIISWVADLLMRMDRISWSSEVDVFDRNIMLFLDEIEVHLHPAWQRKILPVIQKLFKNAQIFISTHSPFVVGSVDGAWIYKFKKEGQFSVLDGDPILSEDSKSFQYILEETFDISQQFGIEIEKKFNQFYNLKTKVLKREVQFEDIDFQKIIGDLSNESIEVQNIIGMELKQIKRNLGIKEEVL